MTEEGRRLRLRQAREKRGFKDAKAAANSFGWSADTYRSHENGNRPLPLKRIEQYAQAFRVKPEWLAFGIDGINNANKEPIAHVQVIGFVGAGEEWIPVDQLARGEGLDEIELGLGDADPIAIGVRGESMSPVYRNGDYLLCSRQRGTDIAKALNQDCVVKTTDGRGYVKVLMRGTKPRHFRLRSYNPVYPDLEDQKLEWVAPIAWVKRR